MWKQVCRKFGLGIATLALCASGFALTMPRNSARAADAAAEIAPLAAYRFDDAANPGKDAMGKYNLNAAGNVVKVDGGAQFDGSSRLYPESEALDISESLTSFTLAFEMVPGAQTDRTTPVSFGWNGWDATKYCWFTLNQGQDADGNAMLRFSTQGDGTTGRDWGSELGGVVAGTKYKVAMSAQLGGNLAVYVNGVKKYDKPLAASWNLKDTNMRFSIGSDCVWGNSYSPYTGVVGNVCFYGFAMTAGEIAAYEANGKLTVGDLTAKVASADADLTASYVVPEDATDEEVLRTVPATAQLAAKMSDDTTRTATVFWTGVERGNGEVHLKGTIGDLPNPDGISATAKLGVEKAYEIYPVVKYDFKDAENLGKDGMGHFDLQAKGGVAATADGVQFESGILHAGYDAAGRDFTDYLNNCTISLKFRMDDYVTKDWWCLFSVDDYYAKKNAGMVVMVENGNLRVNTQLDWWAEPVGAITQGTWYQLDIAVDLTAHKLYAYLNGELKRTVDLPEGYKLTWSKTSTFSLGGAFDGGDEDKEALHISQPGKVTFAAASVFDFAMDATQVAALYGNGIVKSNSFKSTAYVTELGSAPAFMGEVTSKQLMDKMPEAEMLAAINPATVTATLSDGSTVNLGVVWDRVVREQNTWTAEGHTQYLGAGIPSIVREKTVTQVLNVINSYAVTVDDAIQNGSVEVSASSGVAGDRIVITATPDAHYVLGSVTVNGSELSAENGVYATEISDSDLLVSATFVPVEYAITQGTVEHGNLSFSAEKAIFGTQIEVTATPDEHYVLSKLYVNGQLLAPQSGKYLFEVAGDTVVTADFVEAIYNIDVVPGSNGTAEADKATGKFGETVTLTITPAEHYRVDSVKVNGSELAPENGKYSFAVAGDSEVTVSFALMSFETKVAAGIEGGKVSVDKPNPAYGETVTITAAPDEGYELVKVTVNGKELAAVNGKYTVKAEGALEISAEFRKKPAEGGCNCGGDAAAAAGMGLLLAAAVFASKKFFLR